MVASSVFVHAQSCMILQPRGLYPTRFFCLWDFPGNDIGEGGLPFPPSGDLPELGIKPESPASPSLAGGFFTTKPPGKSKFNVSQGYNVTLRAPEVSLGCISEGEQEVILLSALLDHT